MNWKEFSLKIILAIYLENEGVDLCFSSNLKKKQPSNNLQKVRMSLSSITSHIYGSSVFLILCASH